MALGANREAFVSNFISRSVATIILCLAAFHGLLAVALSQFISLPFQMIVAILYVRKHVNFSYRVLAKELMKSALVTIFALAGPLVMVAADGFNLDMHWTSSYHWGSGCRRLALGVVYNPSSLQEELIPIFRWLFGKFARSFGWSRLLRSNLSEPAE